ncbi:transketolase [Propionispira raffinosivorans]|uniref:transketolase n=1 Tax=Propionispira raffinosivorans TaxID=86959 RepID=UPI0003752A33|nr:transketolase [Propionispira raffinosivorans]
MNLQLKACDIRKDIITLIHRAKTGHIGGDLSVTDILVALYYKHLNVTPENTADPNRDRFILSKGHSVESLYCVLADCGFFPKEDLKTYSAYASKYIGHPNNKINGIEMNTGSLGHGLSVGVGMALAGKMDRLDYRVYAVMGDGEMEEGSVWEAITAGAHYKLDNLTAFVDRNHLQISGTTENVMMQDKQEERWAAFGWHVISSLGNDIDALDKAITEAKATKGVPTVIIANTTKGCGVSFMENQAGWHHRVPTDAEYEQAINELNQRRAQYE